LSAKKASSLARELSSKKKLSQELMKRRVLLGVPENLKGVKQEVKAVIIKDPSIQNFALVDSEKADPKSTQQTSRASRFDPSE
jgi:hypothetical protein